MKKSIVFLTLIFCLCFVCCGCNDQAAVDDNDGKTYCYVGTSKCNAYVIAREYDGDIVDIALYIIRID